MTNSRSLANILEQKLRSIFDDDEFVVGVRSFAFDDRDRQTVIDFITDEPNVTPSDICLLALDLHEARMGRDY